MAAPPSTKPVPLGNVKLKRLWAVAHATAAMGVLWSVHAYAELGGAPMSPPADDRAATVRALQRAMRSADGMQTSTAAYTVREITLGSGTVIHEYTSAAGSVFGLAWQGPTMPDLASLLGSYFRSTPQASRRRTRRAAGARPCPSTPAAS